MNRKVMFLRNYGAYNEKEVAKFPPEKAKKLVEKGAVELLNKKPHPKSPAGFKK